MLVLWHVMSSLVPFRSMYVPVCLSCLARAFVGGEKVALVFVLWADAYLLLFIKKLSTYLQIEENPMKLANLLQW